jgi:hypothetical protein
MFSNVSWSSYFSGTLVVLIGYYLVVILIYFRQEIKVFLNPQERDVMRLDIENGQETRENAIEQRQDEIRNGEER